MATFDYAAARADTSSIVAEHAETIIFQRATDTTIAGGAGETTQAWATSLSTGADFQPLAPRSTALRSLGGQIFRPEGRIFLRHGSDVRVGDRFTLNSEQYFVGFVLPAEEDKVVAYASRKALVDG